MPTRTELQTIAKTRLKEVKVLYRKGLYDGAGYLAGYVVETALKARICKILNDDYPSRRETSQSFLTHNLETLFTFGGLKKAFDAELTANSNFKKNWSIIASWSESHRYRPIGMNKKTDIEDILNALEDKKDGILTWIKKRW